MRVAQALALSAVIGLGCPLAATAQTAPKQPFPGKNAGAVTSATRAKVRSLAQEGAAGRGESALRSTLHYLSLSVDVDEGTAIDAWVTDRGGVVLGHRGGQYIVSLPATWVAELGMLGGVRRVDIEVRPATRAVSEGVALHNASNWNTNGFQGASVRVGIVDELRGLPSLLGSELPPASRVSARCYSRSGGVLSTNPLVCDTTSDSTHGTRVAEIITDIAPAASLYVANPSNRADIADAVDWMLDNGVRVINFSQAVWWDGPGDGTSPDSFSLLNTAAEAIARGAVFVTCAGNEATKSWFGAWQDANGNKYLDHTQGEDFDLGILLSGEEVTVQVRWADSWTAASRDLDIGVYDSWGYLVDASVDYQVGLPGDKPREVVTFSAPFTDAYTLGIKSAGGALPAWVQVQIFSGPNDLIPNRAGAYAMGNPAESANPGLLAVGATLWSNTSAIEPYSSQGPTPDGRMKPDIVGVAGTSTATAGSTSGTSFSSPHVAGLAALLVQGYPAETPALIAGRLRQWTLPRGGAPNNTWGYGLAYLKSLGMLTTGVSGSGQGQVTGFDGALTCGNGASQCSATPFQGDSVGLSALPVPGSLFAGWSGNVCSGLSTSCTFTMGANATVTAAFTLVPCTFSVSPTVAVMTAAPQVLSFAVTASRSDCARFAASSVPWAVLVSPSGGVGSGTVTVSVLANSGQQRSGTLAIAGHTVPITQNDANTEITVAPATVTFDAEGGVRTASVNATPAGTLWTASTAAPWLIVSPTLATGNGSLSITASANPTATPRSGSVSVGGQLVAVSQGAATEFTRYLAEGATSTFFDTRLALLNPEPSDTTATVSFYRAGQQPLVLAVPVPSRRRVTIWPKQIAGLESAEFSTAVTASVPLVVDRTMTWDSEGYGSHAETATAAPAPMWYLAEGATHSGFSLFYLLQNPGDAATTVRVRYLRTSGASLVKDYALAPRSRTNIWVNVEEFPGQGQALAAAEFSAVVTSLNQTPIIVERAMYRSNQGRTFNAGHESMGVSTPSTRWFLAEGNTGPFFDQFVLIANPTDTAAQVRVTYLLADGRTYSKTMTAAANARSGIWVDYDTIPGVPGYPLADVALSTTVESLNGVALVVERAMWWPGDGSTWQEAHNSSGATETGTVWAMAEGEVGGARNVQTYVLVANTSAYGGRAKVTLCFEDGSKLEKVYSLLALSRMNAAIGPDFGAVADGKRFGIIVEALGTVDGAPVPQIVVERAMYSDANAIQLAAGTNALATKLRD